MRWTWKTLQTELALESEHFGFRVRKPSPCANLLLRKHETVIPYSLCDTVRDEIATSFRDNYSYLFDQYEAEYQSDRHYIGFIDPIRFRTQESNDVALTATSVRLLGIYSGIIFFIICMTVLALHLTTDSIDQHTQHRILYQMGTDRDDIVKMVSRQSLCYFFTPCLVAFIVALLLTESQFKRKRSAAYNSCRPFFSASSMTSSGQREHCTSPM